MRLQYSIFKIKFNMDVNEFFIILPFQLYHNQDQPGGIFLQVTPLGRGGDAIAAHDCPDHLRVALQA